MVKGGDGGGERVMVERDEGGGNEMEKKVGMMVSR